MTNKQKTLLRLALDNTKNLQEYSIGENASGLAKRLNMKPSEILKLNANENLFLPLEFLRGLLMNVMKNIDPRVYPADEVEELRGAIAKNTGATADQVLLGSGGDQLIDLMSRLLLRPGGEALSIEPSFTMYERCTRIQGARYRSIPLLKNFELDMKAILTAITTKTKLLFLCSPNNPTANQFDRRDISHLAENFPGLLVVDEAYVDFANDTIVDLVKKFDNLIVLRTFSKAFGLAGLRLGYAISNQELIRVTAQRIQMPFAVSNIALKLAIELLENVDMIQRKIQQLKQTRATFIEKLNAIDGIKAFDSRTNFVLLAADYSSERIYDELLRRGIIIKNIGRVLHLKNCLRVTVAPSPMCERFLNALEQILSAHLMEHSNS